MGRYLGTAPSTGSDVVRDNTVQGVTPWNPESLEGCNSVSTCLNEASEESISIFTKSRCQWIGRLIKKKAQTRKIWLFEPAEALGTTPATKAPRGLGGLPKQKCVLKVP